MAHVEFRTCPASYRHWKLAVDGPVATLTMDVDEQGGLVPGYELKLNSYDLGVDIELYDAVQRLRFEHPEVKTVVLTSGKEKIFCAGANITDARGVRAPVEGQPQPRRPTTALNTATTSTPNPKTATPQRSAGHTSTIPAHQQQHPHLHSQLPLLVSPHQQPHQYI